MSSADLELRAAPGHIIGRLQEPEESSAGGILLPAGAAERLPIVKVLHDGGPVHGACEECETTLAARRQGFWIEEGCEVVVAGAAQLLTFGRNHLVIVPHSAIVARVLWMPRGV